VDQPLHVVAVYTAANALLLLVLSWNVGQHRARTNALTPGAMGDASLVRAIRAHGNASEYMPLAMIMLLLLALLQAPLPLLHSLGAVFTVGRIVQAIGMAQEEHPNAIRFTGNLFTGLVYLSGAIACIYYGFAS